MMYSRTVTMCKARHLRNYISQEIGYNVDFQFDYDKDEVRATFSCSDDYADIRICHNADDLEAYIIRRYGAFLIKEGIPNPKNFSMDMKKICEVLTNPQLNNRDNYQEEYPKILSSEEWTQLKADCPNIDFENRIQNASYKKDEYQIRLGLWHG
jgi:hypothetical protein